jgi:Spy/CpxP family protein refolding chaperone
MRTLRKLVVPLLILAVAGFAQPFGGAWTAGSTPQALKEALNLTDEQITKLRELRKAEWDALTPIREQLRANRQAYREKLEAGADPAEIGRLALAGRDLRRKAQEVRESYRKQALAVLTPAQQSALAKLEEAAKLMPAVAQARALNLLSAPAIGPGPGARFGRGFGPGPTWGEGLGPGLGPGPMGWRGWRR